MFYFVSDLHGKIDRYQKLFKVILKDPPEAVFFGGDLLPHYRKNSGVSSENFIDDFLVKSFSNIKLELNDKYPEVFLILGNDDARIEEQQIIEAESLGIWKYIHNKKISFGIYDIFGYAYIPPSPFRIKDWEKFDVSRFVDPGCIAPTDGFRTVEPVEDIEYATIENDLKQFKSDNNFKKSIFLFHSPPYQTKLDRAALDRMFIDHVPLDVHVGSIAIKRFIEVKQPHLTLHGHIHESSSITGFWQDKIGKTFLYTAAWNGPELALVKFNPENPQDAIRLLL
jgi:uncharacterized protein